MILIKNFFKTVVAFGAMVFFVSCSDEIIETTGGIIDNEFFERDTIHAGNDFQIVLSTVAIDKERTGGDSDYLLGQYTNSDFGILKADFVSQIFPTEYPDELPSDATLESAVLTLRNSFSLNDDGATYGYDNFLGAYDSELNLEVSTFENYLESTNLDGLSRVYYSNGENDGNSLTGLGSETVLGAQAHTFVEFSDVQNDSIQIELDLDFMQTHVIDELKQFYNNREEDSDTPSQAEFLEFFKGLKINATNTNDGFVAPFDMSDVDLKLKYHYVDADSSSSVQDSLSLAFNRVFYGLYTHDHASLNNQDEELYVQGSGGYEVAVNLDDLEEQFRSVSEDEQWLINQAKLKIYIKEITAVTADDLYIYGVDADGNEIPLEDYASFSVGGDVTSTNSEDTADPFVEFYITEYVKSILGVSEDDDEEEVDEDEVTVEDIVELRIKVREVIAINNVIFDSSFVSLFSNDAKGVVLLNTEEKAPELEIVYSGLE